MMQKIEGIDRTGIYYLINENDDNKIIELYIGQTRNGINRLDDYNRTNDFWNKVILFLAGSSNFTLDMIRGLEAHAIKKAFESKRYEVSNQNTPKYKINFFSKSTIEEIYEEIQFIMATQGYKMDNAKEEVNKSNLLYATRKGVSATGLYSGEKFQVLEGSQINMDFPAYNDKYNKQREELLKKKDIVKEGDKYILKVNLEFKSPSGASIFVFGGSINGWL